MYRIKVLRGHQPLTNTLLICDDNQEISFVLRIPKCRQDSLVEAKLRRSCNVPTDNSVIDNAIPIEKQCAT
jgi:hypothetical protein